MCTTTFTICDDCSSEFTSCILSLSNVTMQPSLVFDFACAMCQPRPYPKPYVVELCCMYWFEMPLVSTPMTAC
jgi:hypothetical protein